MFCTPPTQFATWLSDPDPVVGSPRAVSMIRAKSSHVQNMNVMLGPTRPPAAVKAPVVLKFGGELLEDAARTASVVGSIAQFARPARLRDVHGGGKEIDAALRYPRHRETADRRPAHHRRADARIVVSVLAGIVNTRFVASMTPRRAAVGLTARTADAGFGCRAAP